MGGEGQQGRRRKNYFDDVFHRSVQIFHFMRNFFERLGLHFIAPHSNRFSVPFRVDDPFRVEKLTFSIRLPFLKAIRGRLRHSNKKIQSENGDKEKKAKSRITSDDIANAKAIISIPASM
jgi:hypothetical protein